MSVFYMAKHSICFIIFHCFKHRGILVFIYLFHKVLFSHLPKSVVHLVAPVHNVAVMQASKEIRDWID